MSDDGFRALGVAVLVTAFHDTRSTVPAVRVSAERFFAEGDFEGWAALAAVDTDRVTAMLTRFRRETHQEPAGTAREAEGVRGAAPSPNVAGSPAWQGDGGEKWEAEHAV